MQQLEESLKRLSFVSQAKATGNKLDIQLTSADKFGPEILAFLVKEKVPLIRYEIMEPSLENVFLEVVG